MKREIIPIANAPTPRCIPTKFYQDSFQTFKLFAERTTPVDSAAAGSVQIDSERFIVLFIFYQIKIPAVVTHAVVAKSLNGGIWS